MPQCKSANAKELKLGKSKIKVKQKQNTNIHINIDQSKKILSKGLGNKKETKDDNKSNSSIRPPSIIYVPTPSNPQPHNNITLGNFEPVKVVEDPKTKDMNKIVKVIHSKTEPLGEESSEADVSPYVRREMPQRDLGRDKEYEDVMEMLKNRPKMKRDPYEILTPTSEDIEEVFFKQNDNNEIFNPITNKWIKDTTANRKSILKQVSKKRL